MMETSDKSAARPDDARPALARQVTDGADRRASRRRIVRWVRRGVLLLFGAVVVAGVVLAAMPQPIGVDVAVVRRAPLVVTVDEDGRTRVKARHTVAAPIGGNLARIELHAGDVITEGEPLARIVPITPPLLDARTRAEADARIAAAQASVLQAQAATHRAELALTLARNDADRTHRLAAAGAAASVERERADLAVRSQQEEYDAARFAARVAGHDVEMARAAAGRLAAPKGQAQDELVVTSPVSGVVLRVLAESEGPVAAGTPLVEVGDPTALEIAVDVLTTDAVAVAEGARVVIDHWGGQGTLRAHVRRVEPSAFTRVSALGVDEQRVNVIVDLDEPRERWSALGDGYRVDASIVVWEGQDVLQAPAGVFFREGTQWSAFVVSHGVAAPRRVTLGHRSADAVEILTGLHAGDHAIDAPSDQVIAGAKVRER